jgi:hypothetical protein
MSKRIYNFTPEQLKLLKSSIEYYVKNNTLESKELTTLMGLLLSFNISTKVSSKEPKINKLDVNFSFKDAVPVKTLKKTKNIDNVIYLEKK